MNRRRHPGSQPSCRERLSRLHCPSVGKRIPYIETAQRQESTMAGKTMSEKVWDRHVVETTEDGHLLYIDLHLVHEVTSPQAFDGLRLAGRTVRRPDLTIATEDHNVPTSDTHLEIADPVSRKQVQTPRNNCPASGLTIHPTNTPGQG